MDGSLDQLLRLLSNRGLEWLRRHIMAMPDPMPLDHPDLGALAMVGQVAPVLTGLRGRISPIEVIVTRRLTADLVRAGAVRVLEGARDDALVRLMLAGGLVARDEPLWQLACDALADDPALPLAQRLALSDDPSLSARAEAVLTAPPDHPSAEDVAIRCEVLMQLCHHGARRPRLSGPRVFAVVFDNLRTLSLWAQKRGCTASVARLAFCLRLLDPDHPVADMMADMMQAQRPDGSFPARLGFGTVDQALSDAVVPTLTVAMALHLGAWRRWRGAAPEWLQPRPLHGALRGLADQIAMRPVPADLALWAATSLTRAQGRDWFARLDAPRHAGPDRLAHLARLCFRDAVAAHHLRGWLRIGRGPGADPDPAATEAAWLRGDPVTIRPAPPAALLALWQRAAMACDPVAFLACARIARHHADAPLTPPIRAMARRMAVAAMQPATDPAEALERLDRLTLLAQLLEPEMPAAAAA